jgi:hypothetical protein
VCALTLAARAPLCVPQGAAQAKQRRQQEVAQRSMCVSHRACRSAGAAQATTAALRVRLPRTAAY